MSNEFCLLERCVPARPLPVALAHCLATVKLGDDARHATLYRIFMTLSLGDKMRVQKELRECKAARRGERLAVVS